MKEKISQQIINYSRRRAKLMSRYKELSHGHKGLRGYGENLFWGIGSKNLFSKFKYNLQTLTNEKFSKLVNKS
jgi:hypothetical protein